MRASRTETLRGTDALNIVWYQRKVVAVGVLVSVGTLFDFVFWEGRGECREDHLEPPLRVYISNAQSAFPTAVRTVVARSATLQRRAVKIDRRRGSCAPCPLAQSPDSRI